MQTKSIPTRRRMPEVSPAAVDEIFAGLEKRAFDPHAFRTLAADLDRQHERLRQLLAAIDAADASE